MNATRIIGNKPVQPPVQPLPVVDPTPTVPLADAKQQATPSVVVPTAAAPAPAQGR